MTRIGKEAEQRIMRSVPEVSELIDGGTSPNDAIIKVARAHGLPAGHVRLLINAYNNGRTTRQRSSACDVLEKAATFDMADPAVIIGAIYPADVKTAGQLARQSIVSDEYDLPPDWLNNFHTKAAACTEDFPCEPPVVYPRYKGSLHGKVLAATQKLANYRRERVEGISEAFDKFASTFGELVRYFRIPGHTPLEEVRAHGEAYFGPRAKPLFDKLAMQLCEPELTVTKYKTKEPPVKPVKLPRSAMKLDKSPYKEVRAALEQAEQYVEKVAGYEEFEKKAVAAELALEHAMDGARALAPQEDLSIIKRAAGQKRAFIGPSLSAVGEGLQFGLGNHIGDSILKQISPTSNDKLKADAYMDVIDPSHEAKVRSIRTQATLHSLLNSPYFEGEDPQQVTDLFNKVVQVSPRIADQPLVLESVLRRYMSQGQTDPHDLDQLLGIETKLKQRDEPGRDPAPLRYPGVVPSVVSPQPAGGKK